MTGCPTALSERETNLLQFYARDRRCVEAGALLGYSTIKLAHVASSIVSIDRHEGYSAPTYRRFRSNLGRYGVAHQVRAVIGEALDHLPRYAGDFGFIDLTGQADLTRAALACLRAPVVAIHDCTRASCEGVEAAIKGYRVLAHVDTLVIVENIA